MKGKHVTFIVLLILVLDQASKIWIKTTMELDTFFFPIEGIKWFRIHFIENPGMAFGLEIGGEYGKMILSIFRIIAIFFIVYVIRQLITQKYSRGLIICASMILAGAIGNMIDSAFYGLIFTDSYGRVAKAFAEEGGYGGFLQGKVVDMLYFPMFHFHLPSWLPWVDHGMCHFDHCPYQYLFFRPVFNLADSSITIGVLVVLFFQKRLLRRDVVTQPEDILTEMDLPPRTEADQ